MVTNRTVAKRAGTVQKMDVLSGGRENCRRSDSAKWAVVSYLERTGVIACLALLSHAAWAEPPSAPPSEPIEESEIVDEEEYQPHWDLLEFRAIWGHPELSHRIKRLKITLVGNDRAGWGDGFAGEKGLVYETDTPADLEAFEKYLTQPLRFAVSPGLHGARGDGSSYCIGAIHVTTNTEEFTVGISRVGFALEQAESADLQNTFYSWGLAHFLDHLCSTRTGTRIPPAIMKELTGEARMGEDKETFEKWNTVRRTSGAK